MPKIATRMKLIRSKLSELPRDSPVPEVGPWSLARRLMGCWERKRGRLDLVAHCYTGLFYDIAIRQRRLPKFRNLYHHLVPIHLIKVAERSQQHV